MLTIDVNALADELMEAYANRRIVPVPPSARDGGLDLGSAYAVEAELARRRRAGGHLTVGRKVGFASRALWRALKLDTLVWAHMYDDTVRFAGGGAAAIPLEGMCAPRIEPEIVFKLKAPEAIGGAGPAAVLESVEWLALGFEIVDCVFAGWKFQPADFVAAYGLHAALVVGEPRHIEPAMIPALVEALPRCAVRLSRNGELVEEGSGRNALKSPALCLSELAAAIARDPLADPLRAGELVSSGTLTGSHPIAAGETWTAVVDDLGLPGLTLRC